MKIELRIYPEDQAAELRRFVEHRVDMAFSGLQDEVECLWVDVGAAHEAGHQGCRVQAEMPGQTDVVAEDTAANVYVAIHRAIDRAGWMAESKLAWSLLDAKTAGFPYAGTAAPGASERAA